VCLYHYHLLNLQCEHLLTSLYRSVWNVQKGIDREISPTRAISGVQMKAPVKPPVIKAPNK